MEWRQGAGQMRVMLEFPKKAEDEGVIIRGVREMMLGMLQEHLANTAGVIGCGRLLRGFLRRLRRHRLRRFLCCRLLLRCSIRYGVW